MLSCYIYIHILLYCYSILLSSPMYNSRIFPSPTKRTLYLLAVTHHSSLPLSSWQPFIYFLQTLEEIQEYSWETEPLRSSTVPVLRSQPSILTQTTSPDLPPTMLAPPRHCHYLSGAACTFMAAMPFLRGFPAILCHWIAVYLSKLCVKTISTVLQNCCLCPTVQ